MVILDRPLGTTIELVNATSLAPILYKTPEAVISAAEAEPVNKTVGVNVGVPVNAGEKETVNTAKPAPSDMVELLIVTMG